MHLMSFVYNVLVLKVVENVKTKEEKKKQWKRFNENENEEYYVVLLALFDEIFKWALENWSCNCPFVAAAG